MMLPLRILPNAYSFPVFVANFIGSGAAVLVINVIYAKLFGNFFNSLLKDGVRFSWILFIFVTVVILLMKYFYFTSDVDKHEISIKSANLILKTYNPDKVWSKQRKKTIMVRLKGYLKLRYYLIKNSGIKKYLSFLFEV